MTESTASTMMAALWMQTEFVYLCATSVCCSDVVCVIVKKGIYIYIVIIYISKIESLQLIYCILPSTVICQLFLVFHFCQRILF